MKIKCRIGTDDKPAELHVANGLLVECLNAVSLQTCDLGDDALRVAPGLIDIQINGYDGVDFNDPDANTDQIVAATRRLWRAGVTAFCPTIITGSFDHIARCISNLVRAADESPEFARAMMGIHVEGPFISPEDGPRGAHPKEHARPPDWNEFQRWQDAARGQIRIITLSPEWPEAIDFIERAAASGVIVAIGHTAATPAQIAGAVKAGVCGFIVPDLPFDESDDFRSALEPHGLALIQMVTPVTEPARLAKLCAATQGFVYAVTMTGTTGRTASVPSEVTAYLDAVRRASKLPVCAGFGIRSRDQVEQLRAHVAGVIVGSALVEVMENGQDAGSFLNSLRPAGS